MNIEEETQARFELTDIETTSIGLVPVGANNAGPFFLLKSKEAQPMADDLEIEEVADTSPPPVETPVVDEDGFFEKMRTNLEKWGIIKARASKDAIAQAAKTLGVDPKKMAKMYGQMMEGEDEEEPMEMSKSAPPPQEPQMTKEDLQKAIEVAHAAQLDAVLEKAKAELEKGYQEKIVALEKQVETLTKAEQDQRDQREEREFLEKAMTYRCLPVSPTDLGGMLRGLSKALAPEDFERWEATLKAADAQMFASNLFGEQGTGRTAEEVQIVDQVAKAAADKNISFEDALLNMPADKQREYLKQVRGGTR